MYSPLQYFLNKLTRLNPVLPVSPGEEVLDHDEQAALFIGYLSAFYDSDYGKRIEDSLLQNYASQINSSLLNHEVWNWGPCSRQAFIRYSATAPNHPSGLEVVFTAFSLLDPDQVLDIVEEHDHNQDTQALTAAHNRQMTARNHCHKRQEKAYDVIISKWSRLIRKKGLAA